MSSWEDHVAFEACCSFFEKVCAESNKKQKTTKLSNFLRDCRKHQNVEDKTSSSLFPIMRLILPQLDRERGVYGIKESVLADLYVDFLRLGKTSTDAIKLKNYRAPKGNQSDAGDFAAVLFSVIKDRHYQDTKMSVAELNARLDEIVRGNANEGRKGVGRVLLDLFKKMSAVQQKWLVRIILKDMKLGMGQTGVLRSFHPDAVELYDVNANLKKVCEMLRDPTVRINEIEIQLFEVFKPMLAERCSMADAVKLMGNKQFVIETKYDGERMLLHYQRGSGFKFFSRNGFDFTEHFGHSADDRGKFSHYLAGCLSPSVKSVILDGEICPYNHKTNTLTQKGQQMDIRTLTDNDPVFQQCLCVYDIVYLNGQVLTNKPLRDRWQALSTVLTPLPGRVQFAERIVATTLSEVVDALNDAIDKREEGIVLKDPDSVYKPNVRTKGGWVKLKPDYSGSLMDQCDLIIMGGYFGTGRRGGVITHFLLGLAVKDDMTSSSTITEKNRLPSEFQAFCRVGSGYSMKELDELLQKLQPHFKKGRPTSSKFEFRLEFGREKPDVFIDPRQSVLLQVKAAEIVVSDMNKVGYTLRFPRVEKVRYDKSWFDCMTLAELESLRKQGEGKLFGRHMLLGEDDPDSAGFSSLSAAKRRRIDSAGGSSRSRLGSSGGKTVGVSSLYKAAPNLAQVMVETHGLRGKVVVVEPCDEKMKKEMEEIVRRHGGEVQQNVVAGKTSCYVETGFRVRAKNVVRSGKVDVVKSSWLLEGCKEKFRPYRPSDMIFTTPETEEAFKLEFDKFGESYTERATMDSLVYSMTQVGKMKAKAKVTTADIADFESVNFVDPYKYGLFRPFTFYVDRGSKEFHPSDLVRLDVQIHGGQIVGEIVLGVTHVIVHSSDLERLVSLKKVRRGRMEEKFHIVTEEWVEQCIAQLKLLEEMGFEP